MSSDDLHVYVWVHMQVCAWRPEKGRDICPLDNSFPNCFEGVSTTEPEVTVFLVGW